MSPRLHTRKRGFTLVEIMIVVAIIALLAAIGAPSYIRARKRAQSSRILDELRVLESAMTEYALETAKKTGDPITFDDVKGYLKPNSMLYSTGKDLFSNSFSVSTVDSPPKLSDDTYSALSDVSGPEFWSPYH